MGLGNLFSKEDKLESLQRQFVPGLVMYLYCSFTIPKPKDKYLILLDIFQQPSFFVINSEPSDFIKNRPHHLKCQVEIKSSEYDFLPHDSYVNCTEIIRSVSLDDIIRQTTKDPKRIKAQISGASKFQIIEAANNAKTLNTFEKELVTKGLS